MATPPTPAGADPSDRPDATRLAALRRQPAARHATATRNADGTLPANALFRLSSGSKLVDKGVNVGLPYLGSAPDLGAFEVR